MSYESTIALIRRACGNDTLTKYIEKDFHENSFVNYYSKTTNKEYRILEWLFSRGAMHTNLGFGEYDVQIESIQNYCSSMKAKRVLEVGCGKGHCTLQLASKLSDVSFQGIDAVEKHVCVARKKADSKCTFVHANILSADASLDSKFNLVFGIESLCHMDSPTKTNAFMKCASQLMEGPGSRLIIIDGFRMSTFEALDSTQQQMMHLAESGFRIKAMPSKAQWIACANMHGFELERDEDWTMDALPFWRISRRIAHVLLWIPCLCRFLQAFEWTRESVSNIISGATVAGALECGAAEYGILVFRMLYNP